MLDRIASRKKLNLSAQAWKRARPDLDVVGQRRGCLVPFGKYLVNVAQAVAAGRGSNAVAPRPVLSHDRFERKLARGQEITVHQGRQRLVARPDVEPFP